MFESDPEKAASSAGAGRGESDEVSPATKAMGEFDLAELAAKFTVHGGGRLTEELSAELALEVVLNEIVQQACLTTGASGAAIVLERNGEWICRASSGDTAPQLGSRLDTEAGLSGACVKSRKGLRCDDTQDDPRVDAEACRQLGVRSVMILPLLLRDELVGVFEVLSSWPSAFGERDERTLEALAQRVLKNLGQISAKVAAPVEPSLAAYTPMADLIVSDLVRNPIGENLVAKGFSEENPIAENRVAENMDAAASAVDYASLHAPVLEMAKRADPDRGIHVMTWVLGLTVLSVAVLLAVLSGYRLSGRKATVRAHPPATVAARSTGVENQFGPAGGPDASVSLAPGRSDGGVSAAPPSASTTAVAGPARITNSPPPEGGLLVYEKGKEIFRLPPVRGSGVMRASAVEPESAVEASPTSEEGGVLHRVEPEYPEEARQKGIEGAVVVDVDIDRDGKVLEVKTVSGSPVLAEAVMDAVKLWVFKPHSVGGHPVQMETRITLNFRLPH